MAELKPCPICHEDEPHTGTCGSSDPRALCNRRATDGQREADSVDIAGLRSAIGCLTPTFQQWIGAALDELERRRADGQRAGVPEGYVLMPVPPAPPKDLPPPPPPAPSGQFRAQEWMQKYRLMLSKSAFRELALMLAASPKDTK